MNKVRIIEDEGNRSSRPYRVMVNGKILKDQLGRPRRFSISIAALIAGTKEVDRLRAITGECS